jgi:cbb3-type cytochrome oxidase subunit 1
MPVLTRWFLKSSLLFSILSVLLGVLLAARVPFRLAVWLSAFNPVFFHLFMVGWVAQLIFGVVFWMFPKHSKETPRGSEALGWVTFWLLNIGLVLRLVGEPGLVLYASPVWGWLVAASAVLQFAAGLAFVANTWGRVKGR